ncbi:hypothetical protein HPC49_10115 [Pyxidicoccus fallax]|uniref:Ferredoxin n=1 Tax=Pyxidicoccus fallax TaxID=394095 RepID=A0A848LK53_9BACT|nr:hypothetical protein [Pyxidicoccus fallax]NMO18090.1 hypothetical protein [Pyxidicoccus fallax]NPC78596.1 hypothetical protein [Pyxidicoccus fallax]
MGMSPLEPEDIRLEESFLDAESLLRQWGYTQGAEPFLGRWECRNPWGIPGPLYVGDDDSCGTGPEAAPNNVYLHLQGASPGGEFLFRQPSTTYELRQVVEAAQINVVSEYSCDGNARWTPVTVAAWWESIQPVREQLRETLSRHVTNIRRLTAVQPSGVWPDTYKAEWARVQESWPPAALRRWLDYLDHGAETYLRRYAFFLSTGRVPALDEPALPELRSWR